MANEKPKYLMRLLAENNNLYSIKNQMYSAFKELCACYRNKGKVLICGNGGSASDAEHIVGELMKGFLLKRPLPIKDIEKIQSKFPDEADELIKNLQCALPAISLVSQSSLITAIGNDTSADMAFAQQVYGYGNTGDILIAISTSGNSKSVLNAAKVAISMGIKVLALTGQSGGNLKKYSDILISTPFKETYLIQEMHIKIYHALCADVEAEIFSP